jgi:hypothetical protein
VLLVEADRERRLAIAISLVSEGLAVVATSDAEAAERCVPDPRRRPKAWQGSPAVSPDLDEQ